MPVTKQTFPVKFSQAQRRVIADLLPELSDRLQVETKNQRTVPFTINELNSILGHAKSLVTRTESGMVRNSLRHIIEISTAAIEDAQGIGQTPASERIYQIRINLKDIEPEIWRRIQVRDCTLDRLHEHIQIAMGWTNSHSHQFEIDGERYGDPELMDDGFDDFDCEDSTVTKLSEILPKDGKRFQFSYEYDFGDSWVHDVLFEGCLKATEGQRYPLCLEGSRNCPPEDVGGPWGYADFLTALSDPKHEDHKQFLEWSGNFDPECFYPAKATKRMKRGRPDWRHA